MMNCDSSSSELVVDLSNVSDKDWDTWFSELQFEDYQDSELISGVDTTIDLDYTSQPMMSTTNSSTGFVGASANRDTTINANYTSQPIMFTTNSSTGLIGTSTNTDTTINNLNYTSQPIMSTTNNSTSLIGASANMVPQYHPMQPNEAWKNHSLMQSFQQHPISHSSANQSNFTVGVQNNQLHYQLPTQELVPCTGPMLNTQTRNLQMNQTFRLQNQQNPNQNQLQFQQGTSNNMIQRGREQGQSFLRTMTAPVGFASPSEFPSSDAWRVYAFRQISRLKERYYNKTEKMHNHAMQLHSQATNSDSAKKYHHIQTQLKRMMAFMKISNVNLIPKQDERVYNYLNVIVNYVNYHSRGKSIGGSSQPREAINQPPKGPAMQPSGAMKLQNNPPPNPSRGVSNIGASMVNFNQNFPSRRPQPPPPPPPQQARITSLVNNTSLQMGIEQKSMNPLQTAGSFKAPQPSVLGTTNQSNSGPMTSSLNRSRSPIMLFSNTTATSFPSHPPSYQPPLPPRQKPDSEKLKQPIHTTNELTQSKVGLGRSPALGSRLLNHCSSPQLSLPASPVKPVRQQTPISSPRVNVDSQFSLPASSGQPVSQQTHVSSQRFDINPQFSLPASSVKPVSQQTPFTSPIFDVNFVLSPESIARSPFILSSPSKQTPPEKQVPSGLPSLQMEESQKLKTPMDSPCQEPQNSKDALDRLTEVVKNCSSNSVGSLETDMNSIEKLMNCVPPYVPSNHIGPYTQEEVTNASKKDIKPQPKTPRELSASLVYSDWYPRQTSTNKRTKTENTCLILEEIKKINGKLLETSMNAVLEPSEDHINTLEGDQGMIVKCLFKNVCFPDLRGPPRGLTSEKMPELVILLLVPDDYPASSPKLLKSGHKAFSEPWEKLYKETLTRFDLSLRKIPGIISLGDMAQEWNANARAVITEFVEERGGKSFSSKYGSWEKCVTSSSGFT